jgi:glucose/arabinose dehydrogenase
MTSARLTCLLIVCVASAARQVAAQSVDDLLHKRLPAPGPAFVLYSKLAPSQPEEVPLRVPPGFHVHLLASGLTTVREMATLPSGELVVTETGAGRIRKLIDRDGDWRVETLEVWADDLNTPYGILRHHGFVYVATTGAVLRFPVTTTGAAGPREVLIRPLSYAGENLSGRGHATRDLLLSRDGRRLFVSVGSISNVSADDPAGRAAILVYDHVPGEPRLFASGIRNPVSITWRPGSEELWTTCNERDQLGNDLVPDYVTSVKDGGFYGWPFFYIGRNEDPRHAGKRPDLAAKVVVPDVLIQSHSAPLGLTFYEAEQFPAAYRNGLFVALHGSWNRKPVTGYKVIFQPFEQGRPSGPPQDFLTGFIKDENTGEVYGRPVAPFVLPDGSLAVSDDGAGRVWRVTYEPEKTNHQGTKNTKGE